MTDPFTTRIEETCEYCNATVSAYIPANNPNYNQEVIALLRRDLQVALLHSEECDKNAPSSEPKKRGRKAAH